MEADTSDFKKRIGWCLKVIKVQKEDNKLPEIRELINIGFK